METQPLYIVQRIEWNYSDEWFYQDGDTPLKAFADRDAAERFRQEKENAARAELLENPAAEDGVWNANIGATFGDWESMSSLTQDEFRQRAREIVLRDFPSQQVNGQRWVETWDSDWWRDAWAALSPDRTALLWNLLDRLRFFEIVEIDGPPLENVPQVHLAQVKADFYRDSPYVEGAVKLPPEEALFAFSDQAAAERWAKERPPVWLNPFHQALLDDRDDNRLIIYTPDDEETRARQKPREIRVDELAAFVRSLGLTPPDIPATPDFAEKMRGGWIGKLTSLFGSPAPPTPDEAASLWNEWWRANVGAMTEEQKTTIWRFVMPFPYDVTVIEAEGSE